VRPGMPIHIAASPTVGEPPTRYVPSTARAARELDLHALVSLDDAVPRTADWYSTGPTRG
jgi:nucleoside-diphosphate-sugar epimerase